MLPSADMVAHAIIAASRETGLDPATFVSVEQYREGSKANFHALAHTRVYAGLALERIFPQASKTALARLIGASYHSAGSFLVVSRKKVERGAWSWFDTAALDRVVAAIPKPSESGTPPIAAITADPPRRAPPEPKPAPAPEPPPYRPPPSTYEKALASGPKRPNLGTRDANGYRPPGSAIERILEDDEDGGAVFDRGRWGGNQRRREDTFVNSRRSIEDELRQAVANTVAMTPARE